MQIRKKKRMMQKALKSLSAIELMDYVSDKYHTSEKRNLSSLNQCFLLMPVQDTRNHPELSTIRILFLEIRKLLQKHLNDSETVYFPAIRKNTSGAYDFSFLKDQAHSTNEHVAKLFTEIKRLSNNYTPPVDASGWMKLCYALLHDLEADTNYHLFVEESILPLKLGA
jgi:regulator of cell morphogenesis and NO signaling